MWTNGRRTKTNSKTSPEQSAIFQLVREINKTNSHKKNCPRPGGHFHDDWAKTVTSRVKLPPPGSHETNVLTKFHENWAKNVTSRVFTCFHYIHIEKNAPPIGGHFFHRSGPFSNLSEISIKPMKTAPPTGCHVFQRTRTTYELNQHISKTNILTNFQLHRYIIFTNVLTKFHEDRTRNVASRVRMDDRQRPVTKAHLSNQCSITRKTAPPPCGHFHDDWANNVTSRVHVIQLTVNIFELNSLFTCFHYIHIHVEKNAPPTSGHVSPLIWTIFKLVRDINKTNVLTNFHDDWAKIVTSRVFTRFLYSQIGKTATKKCPAHWQPCFFTNLDHFELVQDINKTNVLINFHDDLTKIVTSRVFTTFLYSQIGKTAPPTGGHVFQRTQTTFELNQHIIKENILTNFEFDRDCIGTKLLTKFHEDRTRNVASRTGHKSSPEQSADSGGGPSSMKPFFSLPGDTFWAERVN
ncbi:hypothetical protein DPMN_005184 [Dreissena polymorpha]|uniref:Uncharacterized protein n=1 Tax=Dreissena polymorpha TaxID=45954 RepID=A0A9D4MS75_DREPO|nr:hypothetical protein DPMN_005184 [Dreissena polymorpha]